MAPHIIFNHQYYPADQPVIDASNRGIRYGDGCFETMHFDQGKIRLADLHFERLFSSMEKLGFNRPGPFSRAMLEKQVTDLAGKNGHHSAKVRLSVFRSADESGDQSNGPCHMIETESLTHSLDPMNIEGLKLGIFRELRKAADSFSDIKSTSRQAYVLARRFASSQGLDDAIVLNCADRIAETSIANLFIVVNGVIKTPALTEGCVAGVMRRFLIEECRKEGIPVEECSITVDELENASEVFITNAIRGIQWVSQIEVSGYSHQVSGLLHRKFLLQLT